MMPFAFGEHGRAFDKGEGFAEILETVRPLDPSRSVKHLPARRLLVIACGLLWR